MTLFEDVETTEQSKIKKEVWETIQALNRAWAEDGKVVGSSRSVLSISKAIEK